MKVQRYGSPVLFIDDVDNDQSTYLRDKPGGQVLGTVTRFGTTKEGLVKFVPRDGFDCYVEVSDETTNE